MALRMAQISPTFAHFEHHVFFRGACAPHNPHVLLMLCTGRNTCVLIMSSAPPNECTGAFARAISSSNFRIYLCPVLWYVICTILLLYV